MAISSARMEFFDPSKGTNILLIFLFITILLQIGS
jgi:hypothetical protein